MSYYDPPEYHSCLSCDGELKPEYPGVRGTAYICENPQCKRSPYYRGDDGDYVWCQLCDYWVKKSELVRRLEDDDRYHYYCNGCDVELIEPEQL